MGCDILKFIDVQDDALLVSNHGGNVRICVEVRGKIASDFFLDRNQQHLLMLYLQQRPNPGR